MENMNRTAAFGRDWINIQENYEVEYWTQRLDICPEYLKKAVATVGNSIQAVRKYVKK